MHLNYTQNPSEFKIVEELSTELGLLWDKEKAYRILKSVLQTLRNSIDLEDAITIFSNLPAPLQTIFSEGWKAEHHFRKSLYNAEAFAYEVRSRSEHPDQDIAETKSIIEKVFKTIRKFNTESKVKTDSYNEMKYAIDGELIPLFI